MQQVVTVRALDRSKNGKMKRRKQISVLPEDDERLLDDLRSWSSRLKGEALDRRMNNPASTLIVADEVLAATILAIETGDAETLSALRKIARKKLGLEGATRSNVVRVLLDRLRDFAARPDVRRHLASGDDQAAGRLIGDDFVLSILAFRPELESVRPLLGTADDINARRSAVIETATTALLTYDLEDESGAACRLLFRKLLIAVGMAKIEVDSLLNFDHKERAKPSGVG